MGQKKLARLLFSIIISQYYCRLLSFPTLFHNPLICTECGYSLRKVVISIYISYVSFVAFPLLVLSSLLTHMCTCITFKDKNKSICVYSFIMTFSFLLPSLKFFRYTFRTQRINVNIVITKHIFLYYLCVLFKIYFIFKFFY